MATAATNLDLRRPPSATTQAILLCLIGLVLPACGGRYIGTTAGSFLKHARSSGDPNLRYLAYTKLADPQCYTDPSQREEAAVLLAESLHGREQSVALRAAICKTLGQLGEPEARPALLRAIQDPEPLIRAEACRAIGSIGSADDATALARIMSTDTSRDCRVAAIDAIGHLKTADPRIDLKLAEGMRNPDPAIRASSYQALRTISGKDLGVDYQPWQQLAMSRLATDTPTDPNTPASPADGPATDGTVLQASGAGSTLGDIPPPQSPP